jgi:Spy/CpxP family protein refolding chaperone
MKEESMITQSRIFRVALATTVILTTCLFSAQASPPQDAPSSQKTQDATDKDIDLLRKDIRSQKKQLVAANLKLTDREAEQFWPLYDQYTAELVKINDKKYGAIKDFAQNYETLTDEQAETLTRQVLEVDESVAQLRIRYIPIFRKVLSGKKTALFFQLDRTLVMLIDLQLSSEIPLVEP